MCYAIPGKIKEFKDNLVVVDYFGEERKAVNELDDLLIGDYIYAQGGYVIEKIPQEEAENILSVWKETFFELQEVDLQLSKVDLGQEKDVKFTKDSASSHISDIGIIETMSTIGLES